MAAFGTVQALGNANSTKMEVELNTLAARLNLRPEDTQFEGAFSLGINHVYTTTAGAGPLNGCYMTAQMIPDFAGASSTNAASRFKQAVCAIRRVSAVIYTSAMGTASAGPYTLGLKLARGMGPAANSLAIIQRGDGSQRISRQQMGALQFMWAAETSQLPVPVPVGADRQVDSQFVARVTGSMTLVAGNKYGPFDLWNYEETDYPIVLDPGTSIRVEITTPTWSTTTGVNVGISFSWDQFRTADAKHF